MNEMDFRREMCDSYFRIDRSFRIENVLNHIRPILNRKIDGYQLVEVCS